ncbi:MAG: GPW/gp25 family protein [Sedimenticolaceae bacterium]
MDNDFLGRGWIFPLLPDATGALGYREGEQNIAQSLRILLGTALGERVMRPAFGTRAPRLVFAPGSLRNLRLLEDSIREAITLFEPRVDIEEVAAETEDGAENRVLVNIVYRVRRTNSRENLVFPFYLDQLQAAP